MGITVAIASSARCTMSCAHCCFSCTPRTRSELTADLVLRRVDEALAHPVVTNIALSGGEPLLRQDLVLEVASRCKQAHKGCSLVTNGFWAVTPGKARQMVQKLWDAGVATVTVSYDEFHAPFISQERVANALRCSHETPLHIVLNMGVTKKHSSLDLLAALGNATLDVEMHRFPVLPCGAAASIDKDDFEYCFAEENLRCPEFSPLYHFDGNVYPCCSPTVCETQLAVGSVEEMSVAEAIDAMAANSLLYILRTRGVGWLLARARQKNLDVPAVTTWTSPCEGCLALFRNPSVLRELLPDIVHEAESMSDVQPDSAK